MAHFAELDENNIVLRVIVIDNKVTIPSEPAPEIEQLGIDYCKKLYGGNTKWKQTSYNTQKGEHKKGKAQNRKNYAGVGYKYDQARNAFIPPKTHASWILDENTCVYEAPVPYPNDGKRYYWDEPTINWIEIT